MKWTQWLGLAAGGTVAYIMSRKALKSLSAPKLPAPGQKPGKESPEVQTDTINYRICPVCSNRIYDHEYYCIYCARGGDQKPQPAAAERG